MPVQGPDQPALDEADGVGSGLPDQVGLCIRLSLRRTC